MEQLEVTAAFDWIESEEKIGVLSHESLRGSNIFAFEYSKEWLHKYPGVMLSQDLQLFGGVQYSQTSKGIFGCFADALPDRWGRRLIDLRSHHLARSSGQPPRKLSDWDYLKGVEDTLRVGGFRFKNLQTGNYLNASGAYQVPPVLSIGELLEAAREIEKSDNANIEPEERWVKRLLQPGSSVGGACPKACVTSRGYLYIAKFPSVKDDTDVSKWEHFAHLLAKKCGIKTAETKLIGSNSGHDILLSKRFDRTDDGRRVHMASSLTLLGFLDGAGWQTGNGYLDIADFIVSYGCHVEENLEELYRRVAFNICIGNADDHFRNHSFLLTRKGWELSPAYDMNPTLSRHQALLIDGQNNEANLDILFEAHKSYLLDKHTASDIISSVTQNLRHWDSTAKACGISTKEMSDFSGRIITEWHQK